MTDSGHLRDMASCAVLRTIGSKKLPPEARRIRIIPVGAVDVAAVRGGKTPIEPDTCILYLVRG